MNLDEAIAVYLYLREVTFRTAEEKQKFTEAWKMIAENALATIKANRAPTGT